MTARNEPLRGVMDAVTDPAVEVLVLLCASQVGKSELLLNIIGFHVAHDPAPILLLQPTLGMAEAFSKDRVAPMLRDSPALAGKVKDPRSRDSGNTLLHKSFPGGHLTMAGANSPASLASRPIRILLGDEVDRYPPSAGSEGDPVNLARKRTTTFWNRKIVLVSSPTVEGFSRIDAAYKESDQQRYYVPCPDCGEEQILVWSGVQWPEGRPQDARYCCAACGSLWDDAARYRSIRRGAWQATAPFRGVRGYRLSQLDSPWVKLGDLAVDFLEAKKAPETLQVFVNTVLGELWEDQGQRVDAGGIMERLEDWGEKAPPGVLLVTCAVDVQDDRLEIERVGWGLYDESWSLDYEVLWGDPSGPDVWRRLDEYLLTPTETADGRIQKVLVTTVDTGGHHTQAAYRFCRDRVGRRVYAIKGVAGQGRPVWPKRANRNNKGKVLLFSVGVDAAKDAIMARLKIEEPGPGYCHFPKGRDVTYFEQFSAETKVTKKVRGFPTAVWVKRDGIRNEAIDLRAYNFAALQAANVNWSRVQARMDGRIQASAPPPQRAKHELAPTPYAPPIPQAPPSAEPTGALTQRNRRGRTRARFLMR